MKKTGASFFLRNLIRISVAVMSSGTDVPSTLTVKYKSSRPPLYHHGTDTETAYSVYPFKFIFITLTLFSNRLGACQSNLLLYPERKFWP